MLTKTVGCHFPSPLQQSWKDQIRNSIMKYSELERLNQLAENSKRNAVYGTETGT